MLGKQQKNTNGNPNGFNKEISQTEIEKTNDLIKTWDNINGEYIDQEKNLQ